ncbi:DUF3000 domain-containing protein [Actinotalea sp. K2]|nr:DUF3000 domain-containing protein [Actinotalea sp. K2]MCL3862224.1 DUF3000 domain-containing protein [Actinotalea sp. K2]
MTADADVPAEFVRALQSLRDERLRPEVHLSEVPAPGRIAPFSVALTGEIRVRGTIDATEEDPATGRIVVLHDPVGQEAWDSTFRVVTLVRASLDPEVGADPLLCEAAWTWVQDALQDHRAEHRALGGTVTRVLSQTFGALAERPDEVEVEIRASWSPPDGDLGPHLAAWSTLLCTAAGLPPVPDGVTALGRRH